MEEKTGSYAVRYGYDFLDNKISQTDPRDGVQTAWWSYDWAGRVLTETRQEPAKKVVARTVYDALGQKKSFTDFRGNPTSYTYDLAGRLLEQVAKLSDGMNAVTRYGYDAAGNVTRQDVLAAGGKYRTTRYTYDAENRVVDTIVNDGQAETRTRNVYDAIGNKLVVYTGMLGSSLSGAAKTSYTYDKLGNVLSMTDPVGNAPNPQQKDRRTEWYRYDQYGKLTGKTDRNGYVSEYRYDVLGRVLSETVRDPDGREPALVQSFSYYKNGRKQSEENGELRSVFTYDNRGLLISQTETCKRGKVNLVVKSYAYDGSGNRQSFTLSKDGVQQLELGYSYDRQNRLSEVKRGGQVIASYQYDENGNRASLSHPQSGLATTYAYNAGNLVTSLVNRSGNVVRSSFSYEYAPDGNQVKKVSQIAGKQKATSYVYDLLGRLTEEKVSGGETVSYAYDRFSNRRTMTVMGADGKAVMSSYEYDLRSRLLKETKKDKTSEETYVYRYDWNGNQLQRLWERYEQSKGRTEPGRVSFAKKKAGEVVICERRAYNGLNQLTSLYQDGEVTRYRYRPDGLRLCKEKADGSETGHIWDGSEMVAEYQSNGTVIARYLRGINLIARELDGQQEYYLHNAHGDVVQRTDRYGTPLKSYDYDAFGNEEKPEELDHNPWRYCGEYLDLEAQNYYLRARCYEPRIGRFTTEDVAHDGLNWYTYCGNNPVMFADPSGNTAYSQSYGGGYRFVVDNRATVTTYLIFNSIPFFGTGIELTSSAAYTLADKVEINASNRMLQSLPAINNALLFFDDSTGANLAKKVKLLGKISKYFKMIGTIKTLMDFTDLWSGQKVDTIDQIIQYEFSAQMFSTTREQVEEKYSVAFDYLLRLLDKGKLTYTTNRIGDVESYNIREEDIRKLSKLLKNKD